MGNFRIQLSLKFKIIKTYRQAWMCSWCGPLQEIQNRIWWINWNQAIRMIFEQFEGTEYIASMEKSKKFIEKSGSYFMLKFLVLLISIFIRAFLALKVFRMSHLRATTLVFLNVIPCIWIPTSSGLYMLFEPLVGDIERSIWEFL